MLHALFEIYRRTLWLLTVLLALSVVTFALAPAPTQFHTLPKFINPQPTRLNHYAWMLAQTVANDAVDATAAAQELARLGAVALPHVLPKLDSLPPEGRSRVLEALEPVAMRMGLAQTQGNVARLSGTWLTYLSDNSVYLHPAMAKRIVERFAVYPSAQHARDLRRLDTLALGELIQRLRSKANNPAAQEQLHQVVTVLRQITGHDTSWSLPPPNAEQSEATKAVLEKWRRWWFAQRPFYEPATATSHLTAPLLQTQFALWVRAGAGAWFDRGVSSTLGAIPWLALVRTVCLFTFAVFGGRVLARMCNSRRTPERARRALGGLATTFGWLPAALVATGVYQAGIKGMWIAVPSAVVFGAAFTLRRNDVVSPATMPNPVQSTDGATYTATLLGVCLLLEWGLRIDGLGQILLNAVKHADTTPILCVALVNTFLIGIVQYFSPRPVSESP